MVLLGFFWFLPHYPNPMPNLSLRILDQIMFDSDY